MKRRHQHYHPCSSPDRALAPAQGETTPVLKVRLRDGQVLTESPKYRGLRLLRLPEGGA
jgi:hypothetical protein